MELVCIWRLLHETALRLALGFLGQLARVVFAIYEFVLDALVIRRLEFEELLFRVAGS